MKILLGLSLVGGHLAGVQYGLKKFGIENIIKQYYIIKERGSFHTNPYHNYYILEKI